jgi:hypothetical protein
MKRIISILSVIVALLSACTEESSQGRILMNGESEITLSVGEPFTDPGVVAIEGDSFLEVAVRGQVDTGRVGVYIILYEAIDSTGKTLSITRTVSIKDQNGLKDSCTLPNGNQPCWNSERQAYLIEEGAVIVIGVDSMTMGRALEEQWRRDYPQYANILRFENYNTQANQAGGTQGIIAGARTPDVALVTAAGV